MKYHRDQLKKSPFLLIQNARSSFQRKLNYNDADDEKNVIILPTQVTASENVAHETDQNSARKHYHADRSFTILPGLNRGVVCALPIKRWKRLNSTVDIDSLVSLKDSERSKVNYDFDTFFLHEREGKTNHQDEPTIAIVRVSESNDIFQLICDTKYEQNEDNLDSLIDRIDRPRKLYFNQKFWKYFCDYRQLLQIQTLKLSDKVTSVVRIPFISDHDQDQSQTKYNIQPNSQLLHQDNDYYDDDYVIVDSHMLTVLEQSMKVEVLLEWEVLKKAKENGDISLSKIWDIIRTVKNVVPLIEKDEILSHNLYQINFNQFIGFAQSFETYIYDLRTSPPKFNIHIVQAKETSITISVKSDRSCVLIVSVNQSNEIAPTKEEMKRLSQTKHARWKKLHIPDNNVYELEIASLNHGTKYKMYLYWELNISEFQKTINSSNMDITQSCMEFETKEEVCSKILLPSWDELEESEQRIEILAAIRDQKIVLECSRDNVHIPSVSDDLSSTDILNDESWKEIIDWWRQHEDIRYSFCFREVKYAARDEEIRSIAKEEGVEIVPGDWNSTVEKKRERWHQFCWWYYGTKKPMNSNCQSDSKKKLPVRHKTAYRTEHKVHLVQPLSTNIFSNFPGKPVKKANITEHHQFYKKSQMPDMMNKFGTLEDRFRFTLFAYGSHNDKSKPEEDIYILPYDAHDEKLSSMELSRHLITTVALSFVISVLKNVFQEDKLSNHSNLFVQKRIKNSYNATQDKFTVDSMLSTYTNDLDDVIYKDSTITYETFNAKSNETQKTISSPPKIIPRQNVKSPQILAIALEGEPSLGVNNDDSHEQKQLSSAINEHTSSTSASLSMFNGVRKARQLFLNSRIKKVDTVSNSVKKLVALTTKKNSLKGIQLLRAKAKLVILTQKLEKIGLNKENFSSKDNKEFDLDLFQDYDDGEFDFDTFAQRRRRSSRDPIVKIKENIGKQKKFSSITDVKPDDTVDQNSIKKGVKFYSQWLLRHYFNVMRRSNTLKQIEDNNKNGKDNNISSPTDISSKEDLDVINQNALMGIDPMTKFESTTPILLRETLDRDLLGWERRMFSWEEYLSQVLQVHTKDQKRLSQNKSSPLREASLKSDFEITKLVESFNSLGLQNIIDDCPDYFESLSILTDIEESNFSQMIQKDRCNMNKKLLYEKDCNKTVNLPYVSPDITIDDVFSDGIWQKQQCKSKSYKGSDILTSPPRPTVKYRITTSLEQKQIDCEDALSAAFLKHQRDVSFQEIKYFAKEDSYSITVLRHDVLDKFLRMYSKKYERVSLRRRKRRNYKTMITRRLRKQNDFTKRNCVDASRTLYIKYKNSPPVIGLTYDCRNVPLRISYNICPAKKKATFPANVDKLQHSKFFPDEKNGIKISDSDSSLGQNEAFNQKVTLHGINMSLTNTSKVPDHGQCFEKVGPFTREKTKGFFIKGTGTG